MSDNYAVTVLRRDATTVSLLLALTRWQISVPVGPSFARMLIEDSSCPGHKRFKQWQAQAWEKDENAWLQDDIRRVEITASRGLPRKEGEPAAGLDLDDPGGCGEVELEIEVADGGWLEHLDPGAKWRTTAYDELRDGTFFTGLADDVRSWRKP